ncbi:uncharacterized protein [Elaeis guineensis]|uniref:uncharacterized protein n=1 Tax=Elaeis guineensis var. tenera TaxID=51953 RepID=UPI003C6D7BCC
MVETIDHLESFKAVMLLQEVTDAILCRAFPSTLKGAVRHRYFDLKSVSIHSFKQLSRSFICHFVSRQQKHSDYLHTVKQKEEEAIQSFVSRFNAATLEVHDLDQSVAMSAMMSRLQKNDLKKSLLKTYPRD